MFGTTFVVNNKGYLFVGANFNSNNEKASLWEYDPASDIWTEKAELPGGPARSSVAAFVIEGKAYLVGGNIHLGSAYDEVWSYNPADNSWASKKSFPGHGRVAAFGFAFDGKGYIGGGCQEQCDVGGKGVNEFWQYEPASDSWTKLDNYPGDGYYRSITSQDNNHGYVFGGGAATIKTIDFWRFDPNKL